jgi:NitT/TauT family transport system ATP-binding protein
LLRNIQLPAELKRRPPDHDRIQRLIKRVGLEGFEATYPRELSGGMQQRAAIVRSLSYDPSLLLMDEPFGALDAFTRDEMNLLIQEIWQETGKTVVFVTHSITEAVYLSDRIVVLSPRPGRVSRVFAVDFPRPRPIDLQTRPEFIERVIDVKRSIDHHHANPTVSVK